MVRKITKDPHKTESGLNGTYYDEEAGDFREDTVVAVHCADEEEAREVAKVVSEHVGIDQ